LLLCSSRGTSRAPHAVWLLLVLLLLLLRLPVSLSGRLALALRSSFSLDFYSVEVAGAERDAPAPSITRAPLKRCSPNPERKALPERADEVADGFARVLEGFADVFYNLVDLFHNFVHYLAGNCIDDLAAVRDPKNAQGCVEA
jgi:hypothetical protein